MAVTRKFRLHWPDRRAVLLTGVLATVGVLCYRQLPGRGLAMPVNARSSQIIGQDFPLTIVDPTGATQSIPRAPQRIVSTTLACDEILSMLVTNDRVAGVSFQADNPNLSNAAGHYPASIPRNHQGLEELLALEPDLVILPDQADAASVQLLIASGTPLLRFSLYESFDGIAGNVGAFALALGVKEQGRRIVDEMRQRLAAVEQAVRGLRRPRVLWFGISGATGGIGTLSDDTISRAGGRNVTSEAGIKNYAQISHEFAIGLQPEAILLEEWPDGISTKRFLMNSAAWKDVPAIRDARVYPIPTPWGTSGTPFRAKGVEAVARVLHPEVFRNVF